MNNLRKMPVPQPRNLVQICTEDDKGFATIIHGMPYCSLRMTQAGIDCPYRAKHQDRNGLYQCDHLRYKKPATRYVA